MPGEGLDRERRAGHGRADALGGRQPDVDRDRPLEPGHVAAARPRPARRWRPRRGRARPTWAKTSSAQRSGRPVTKTTGTPRSSSASITARVAVGDGAVGADEGAVEVGGDEAREHHGSRPPAAAGSGRAKTRLPSSSVPRRSVKPHLASTLMLGGVGRLDAGPHPHAAGVGLGEHAPQRLGGQARGRGRPRRGRSRPRPRAARRRRRAGRRSRSSRPPDAVAHDVAGAPAEVLAGVGAGDHQAGRVDVVLARVVGVPLGPAVAGADVGDLAAGPDHEGQPRRW